LTLAARAWEDRAGEGPRGGSIVAPYIASLRPLALAALAWVLLAPATASAAALPFRATLEFAFSTLAPIVVTGTGTAVSDGPIGGAFQSLAIPAGAVATAGIVVPVTDPGAAPIQGVVLSASNPAATFDRSSGALGGTMPLQGILKVCLFEPCGAAIANLVVPLSPFGAEVTVATNNALPGGTNTVFGAPWTTGTATNFSFTAMGSARGPASGASTTFSPGGRIRLVVPVVMLSNIAVVPARATFTIEFVPEPTTLVLLGGGIGALAIAGRARRA
jgi:hypothetical protein